MTRTRGPWMVDPNNDRIVVTSPDGDLQVCETFRAVNPEDGDAAADARLIAAAPDLLEACTAARRALHRAVCVATASLYDNRSECETAANDHVVIKALDVCVAKAEGRS